MKGFLEAVGRWIDANTDAYLPSLPRDPAADRQVRAIIIGTSVGLVFSVGTGTQYALFGSMWSALAIHLITLGLMVTPYAIRRGTSTRTSRWSGAS